MMMHAVAAFSQRLERLREMQWNVDHHKLLWNHHKRRTVAPHISLEDFLPELNFSKKKKGHRLFVPLIRTFQDTHIVSKLPFVQNVKSDFKKAKHHIGDSGREVISARKPPNFTHPELHEAPKKVKCPSTIYEAPDSCMIAATFLYHLSRRWLI